MFLLLLFQVCRYIQLSLLKIKAFKQHCSQKYSRVCTTTQMFYVINRVTVIMYNVTYFRNDLSPSGLRAIRPFALC